MGSIGIQFTPTYTVGYVNRKSFVYGTDRIIPASDNMHTGQDRIIPARDNTQTGQDRTGQDHPPSHPVTTGEERTGSSSIPFRDNRRGKDRIIPARDNTQMIGQCTCTPSYDHSGICTSKNWVYIFIFPTRDNTMSLNSFLYI